MQQTEQDIANSRVIDRSIRPIFPSKYPGQVHVSIKKLPIFCFAY